jgi:hypothetical protein
MNSATLVQKLWNCCNVLRDDRMRYGTYVEQLSTSNNCAPKVPGSLTT